jgi:hypothetical protein
MPRQMILHTRPEIDFQALFERIAYDIPIKKGVDETSTGRRFWSAQGQQGMVYYSNNKGKQLIWGHDPEIVIPALLPSDMTIYASNIRVNSDGAVSVRVEPGYIPRFLPAWTRVPLVARTFSPLRDSEHREEHRFSLSLDDICTLFRTTYIEPGPYACIPFEPTAETRRDA